MGAVDHFRRVIRVAGVAVGLGLTVAFGLAGCAAEGGPTPKPSPVRTTDAGEPADSGIRLLGPDEPVLIDGNPVALVIEVTDGGEPVVGAEVTFTVESGPASLPGGFEAAITDETGVAVATALEALEAGDVVVRVAAGERTTTVKVTLLGE